MSLDAALGTLAGKKILVLGATGFIGSRLTEILADAAGAEITAAVRNPHRAEGLARLGVRVLRADLNGDMSPLLAGQDVIFNLAYDVRQGAEPNLARFRALVRGCRRAGVGRLVHASSIAVYDGWPGDGDLTEASPSETKTNPYKRAKVTMEVELLELARAGALASAILQPTLVYGPKSLQWTDLPAEKLLAGGLVLPDDDHGACNAVYVDDVVQGLILAAVVPQAVGERFILSGAGAVRWRDLLGGYAQALGRPEALILQPVTLRSGASSSSAGRLMALAPVRAAASLVRAAVGESGLARLRALARGGRTQASYPNQYELGLYRAAGVCRIDKARVQLGYAPAFDLARGLEATAPYLRAKAAGA